MSTWIDTTVIDNKHWNERLCSLRLAVKLPAFKAGQFLRLGLEIDGELVARAYSLVNPPDADEAEFYFNRVLGGALSTRLHALEPGDKLKISTMITGFLTLDALPPGKNLWMLATGTALGPFLSILAEGHIWACYDKVVLVHGVRDSSELAYQDFIKRTQQTHPDHFATVSSVTREKVIGTLSARIPDALRDGSLEQQLAMRLTAANDRVMLCGNPGMVKGCVDALAEKGLKRHRRLDPGQVVMEIYK